MNSAFAGVILCVAAIGLWCRALTFRAGRFSRFAFAVGLLLLAAAWIIGVGNLSFRTNRLRLVVSDMTHVENAAIGHGVELYRLSQARIIAGPVCGGVIRAEKIKQFDPDISALLGKPKDGMALLWITDLTAKELEITGDLLFLHDARRAAPGIWIGWIPEPFPSDVRHIDYSTVD